ncbi:MAG: 3-dehydroquinate dehydratase [Muribaculaceae bacterium]|nr:3-dehydroquinate dehydratase [Muribaculaceae bacterium]MBQ9219338.1 3-dehydroquinate dehydratase [Muribaculaceae bacterium]
MKKIAIINGPNLNLVGRREPELYGHRSLDDYLRQLADDYAQVQLTLYQSNHEGDIIDELQRVGFDVDGIVLNAGGYTHTSIAIADAVAAITAPVVEVHITDITRREPWRRHSMLTAVCTATIMGQGLDGYRQAVEFIVNNL